MIIFGTKKEERLEIKKTEKKNLLFLYLFNSK